jgi:uncharacterized membrane protein YgcG
VKIKTYLNGCLLLLSFSACGQTPKSNRFVRPNTDSLVAETRVKVVRTEISKKLPKAKGPTSDYANVLTTEQVRKLDSLIRGIWKTTNNEICVSILDSSMTSSNDLDEFCDYMYDSWDINDKKGVLIVIAPSLRKIELVRGSQLNTVLPDDVIKALYKEMYLDLHQGNYFEGLKTGILSVSKRISDHGL